MTSPIVTVTPITRYSMTISADMFDWLKSLMQNPIYEDEDSTECKYRESLFVALQNAEAVRIIRRGEEYQSHRSWTPSDDEIPF